MSAFKFTEEQLSAITAAEPDILVSAAAGSGKTAVLSERIVRMISEGEHPYDIDRILVVTFTRAAAAAMKEKIADNLSGRLAADPGNAHLRRQEVLLAHAKIMTIDAFCQYILRNNFEEIGLDPSFRVADEGEISLLQNRALEEILEESYTQAREEEEALRAEHAGDGQPLTEDPELYRLVEVFSPGATDKGLGEEILRLYRFSESLPWPSLWLEEQLEEKAERLYITYVIKKTRAILLSAAEELEASLEIVRRPGGPHLYEDTITADIESLREAAQADSYEDLKANLGSVSGGIAFGRLPGKKDDAVLPELRERVKAGRDRVKDRVKKLAERYYGMPSEEEEELDELAHQAACGLVRLTLKFSDRLAKLKRERNVIDFSDMEHLALQILAQKPERTEDMQTIRPTQTARAYGAYFHEILIDEYQDSNLVQELILGSIAAASEGHCRRFMVGDVKQSIYRFRLARPELFMDKLARYRRDPGGSDRRIDLHCNFRSRREVLSFCNEIFERIMRPDTGGVDYDEDAMLRPGAEYPEPAEPDLFAPELLLMCADAESYAGPETDSDDGGESADDDMGASDGADDEEDIPSDAVRAEASMVAARILQLRTESVVSDGAGGLRNPRFSDIVILLRTTTGVDEVYRDVLTQAGIPVHCESKTGYFKSREVRVLTDLLSVLENPLRDIPLAGVMRSVIFGFTDEELAQIRLCGGGSETYYDCVCRTAGQAENGKDPDNITNDIEKNKLAGKCSAFLESIRKWREEAGRKPVRELLDGILTETHYEELVGALPAGNGRRANVRMLMFRASEFEKAGGHGLTAFVDRLDAYRRVEVDFGEANALSEEADLVRIMSIHKSKGLEYPVVFVSGLSRIFNRSDERAACMADEQFGIGTPAVDLTERTRRATLRRYAIADRLHEESIGEELRVLYVALTRAKEKLILTGTMDEGGALALLSERKEWLEGKKAPSQSSVVRKLSYLDRIHAASYMDLLRRVLICCAPSLKVTRMSPALLKNRKAGREEGAESRKTALTDKVNDENIDRYLMEEIRKKLSYTYAHSDLEGLFVKTTVTELKERKLEEEEGQPGVRELFRSTHDAPLVPSFLRGEKTVSGAARGTLYHKVMEKLDAEILGVDEITNEDLIIQNRYIVAEWMKKRLSPWLGEDGPSPVDPKDVLAFLCSNPGKRFVAAYHRGELYREKQFMMDLPATRVDPSYPAEETVLLQGIVDVFFIEEGQIVILDYKTDRVSVQPQELSDKYGIQLALYAEALSRIMEMPVKEKWIWSFDRGVAVPVETV